MMNCRASSSSPSEYSMQLISCLPFKSADCQRPVPARMIPHVVIRIGSVTERFVSHAALPSNDIALKSPKDSKRGVIRAVASRLLAENSGVSVDSFHPFRLTLELVVQQLIAGRRRVLEVYEGG